MCGCTFGVYRRHVAPVVSLDNVHHGSGLLGIRRHHSHEVLIKGLKQWKTSQRHTGNNQPLEAVLHFASRSHLIAEVHTGGRVGNLWYVKQLQKVLDLDGHGAGSRSN